MTRRSDGAARQPDRLLQQLGAKWTREILRVLDSHARRFFELEEELGVAANTLSRVLRALERDGFIARFESPAVQRQVRYALTPLGREFCRMAISLEEWAARHEPTIAASRRAFDRIPSRPAADLSASSHRSSCYGALTYAAVVVHDADEAARAWAEVFNVPTPEIADNLAHVGVHRQAAMRSAWLRFGNLRINLIQPTADASPFRDLLARRGQSFHHIGFEVRDVPHQVSLLKARGGRQVLGNFETQYGELDFRTSLGTAVELIEAGCVCHDLSRIGPCASLGSATTVSSMGIAVRDVERTGRNYLSTLGLKMSPIRNVQYTHKTAQGSQRGRALTGTIRHNRLALNLVQPVAGGVLQPHVAQFGSAFHQMGFCVREPLDGLVSELQHKGGRLVVGDPAEDYVQIDLMERLGIILEVTRTSRRSSH